MDREQYKLELDKIFNLQTLEGEALGDVEMINNRIIEWIRKANRAK